jgi:hypothetical protein
VYKTILMVLKHSGGNGVCFPNVNKKFYMVSAMHKGKVTSNERNSGVASRKDRQSNGPARRLG